MTEAGFVNPSHDLAFAFRSILDALSRPGRILPFAPRLQAPPHFGAEAAAVALTLCDMQTPIWLGEGLRHAETEKYLRFHTGAPITDDQGAASFAFVDGRHGCPAFTNFAWGTHEYPDRSATLVIKVDSLDGSRGVSLTGPGIQFEHRLDARPLCRAFWTGMIAMRGDFPLGLDVIVIAAGVIAAVPRATQISMSEGF